MRKIALFRPKIEFSHEPRSVLIRKDSLGVTTLFDNLLREFRQAPPALPRDLLSVPENSRGFPI